MSYDLHYYLMLSYEHERLARRFDNQTPCWRLERCVAEEIAFWFYVRNEPIPHIE